MPYGSTLPHEYLCETCNKKAYPQRLNKKIAKKSIKKFCNSPECRAVKNFKPKECKHSS